jgi:hypothetical protein
MESPSQSLVFALHEAVVEARVVGDENAAAEALGQFVRHLGKGRRAFHHLVADPCQLLDEFGDRPLRVDEGVPGGNPVAVHFDNADLGDSIERRVAARGLEVDEGEAAGNHERNAEGHGTAGENAGLSNRCG